MLLLFALIITNSDLILYSIKSNSNNNSYPMTSIEREAADRQSSKLLSKSNSFAFRSKAAVELNRISNKLYNDNQPTMDYPNSTYW